MALSEDKEELLDDEDKESIPNESIQEEPKTLFDRILAPIEKKNPKLGRLFRDIRFQAFILFLLLLILYLNLIIWDFYFSSDSVPYGITMKEWFEDGEVDNYKLYFPFHPLTMPLAILFTYPMLPIVGSNYLLSYAVLNAILGAATVAFFYVVCYIFVHNRRLALVCSLALAFSFAFWENGEMAEDKSLGFLLFIMYVPLLFSYVGEISPFKRFEALKEWQKGLVLGLFMGLTIVAHLSFILLFLFTLIIGLRYKKLKFLKSSGFLFFIIGAALFCGIAFGLVAWQIGVGNLEEFIGMFTSYHTGEGGKQYFAPANPAGFSLTVQVRGMCGGVFTTLFFFISQDPGYKTAIIGIGAVVFLIIGYIIFYARKNKVVNSFYILMIIWFFNYFFFAPDDRNAWVYLLVPVWLSVCIGLDIMQREGITMVFLKRRLPDKLTGALTPVMTAVVVVLLINNGIVFSDAHFNHDEREEFINFAEANIENETSIFIVDESLDGFFTYYSDYEAESFINVVANPEVSDHINSSFENGTEIYVCEYWLLDSYIQKGSPRTERNYEARLELHKMIVAAFNSMYNYTLVYEYEWSDIYIITDIR
jgi:MFS family permease